MRRISLLFAVRNTFLISHGWFITAPLNFRSDFDCLRSGSHWAYVTGPATSHCKQRRVIRSAGTFPDEINLVPITKPPSRQGSQFVYGILVRRDFVKHSLSADGGKVQLVCIPAGGALGATTAFSAIWISCNIMHGIFSLQGKMQILYFAFSSNLIILRPPCVWSTSRLSLR